METIKLVYFIGIGGIGMSAIARYFHQLGAEVHGYDRTATRLTRTLEAEGIHIHYTEDVTMVPQNIDLVVYTPAVPSTHAELVFLREQNLPIMKRAEVLGLISQNRKTLAVAGTHGKTSTSTILAHLLRSGGVEAAAFLGGIALNYGSNFIPGQSEWVVVEADEYDRSFLHLHPECAVVLSADADHLDIYGDHATMLETGFRAFLKLVKRADGVWVQTDVMKYFPNLKVKAFGLENGAAYADNIRVENGRFHFDYVGPKAVLRDLSWQHPGRHNVENAVAAITLALEAEADPEGIRAGLSSFLGIRRRYEQLVRRDDLVLINDYAHHPTE
ncbi:MAG: Mur ligase domain-containing protein, partial [Bacteroidota bacterium]